MADTNNWWNGDECWASVAYLGDALIPESWSIKRSRHSGISSRLPLPQQMDPRLRTDVRHFKTWGEAEDWLRSLGVPIAGAPEWLEDDVWEEGAGA